MDENDNGHEPETEITPQAVAPPEPEKKAEPEDSAPKKRRGRPPGSKNQTSVKKIEDALNEYIAGIAMMFALANDQHCAAVVAQGGPRLAQAWAEVAKQNPAVYRVLERMMQGGAWGGVIISTLAIALPIMEHHNVLPAGLPNPFASPVAVEEEAPPMTPAEQAAREGENIGGGFGP